MTDEGRGGRQTPNIERPTPNVEVKTHRRDAFTLTFGVGRSMFGVRVAFTIPPLPLRRRRLSNGRMKPQYGGKGPKKSRPAGPRPKGPFGPRGGSGVGPG